ncbi:hypothetical protein GCM10023187_00050 [Nibrella viscosa]|uniref:3-keto-alpha-glucoside-1,2-lyase/3-keto-2-hydroxy-glucal hydratase domain-containing protein n=1 Tax=Nibrella viscosa TaxID=1084524 RepID=A0ABP8JQ40_9BACT
MVRAWSGGIYDEARRGWLADLTKKPAGQKAFNKYGWNKYRIEANGPMLSVSVNGVPTASIRDTVDASGFIALQVHGTKVERPLEVRWRNIQLMEIGR